jgi:hypothetical protein
MGIPIKKTVPPSAPQKVIPQITSGSGNTGTKYGCTGTGTQVPQIKKKI